MFGDLRSSKFAALAVSAFFLMAPIQAKPVPAAERYPEVARLSFVSGGVSLNRGDDPDEWDDALENAPLTVGDRLFTPADGRAELQLPSGNFIRLAPQSYLSTLNLAEDIKQFYLGEGTASFEIRRLAAGEIFEIDTPNVAVTFEEPGRYRIDVDENGDSRVAVRRGRASVAANGRQMTVENSEIRIYGTEAPRYEIVGLPADDGFDRWVAERDHRFERAYADTYRYTSEDVIGAEDLAGQGRWEQIPDYGYAWTPTVVAAGWSPFSNGRWYWKDPWGWSWISRERWGWATSHYGRWTPYRSRWYWVPVRPRTRVRYAPACVEFVRVRDHVGWFPLHPRDRHIPWWERRDRRLDRNVIYLNRQHVTVIHHNHFIAARPVHRHLVRDAVIVRDARAARFAEALPIPSRNSLRLPAEDGRRRAERPSERVLERVAVVRATPSAPPRTFQEKLPEIQKNQGRPVEAERVLARVQDDRRAGRVRVRPVTETGRGDFAPRNPGADAGRELRPVTETRGKPVATSGRRDDSGAPDAQAPAKVAPPAGGISSGQERAIQAREEQQRRAAQQKEAERKAQTQKQAAPGQSAPVANREQQRLEQLERQTRQREQDAKAQQDRQEQARRQQLQQQQRQAEQLKQQEAARRQQALQQQEQARRALQLREKQKVEGQQQQEPELRKLQRQEAPPQHLQERAIQQRQEQVRQQQLRQQQSQTQREAQQIQRQQQQERIQQLRQIPPQQRPGVAPPQLQPAR